MGKILVAIDHSDVALSVVDFAVKLGKQLDAEIVLFTVADSNSATTPQMDQFARSEGLVTSSGDFLKVCSEDLLYRAELRAAGQPGARVTSHWRMMGDPAKEIAKYAREESCDMIVVGHRDRGVTAQFLMGSVARQLMDLAPCPVVVVPERI